MMDDRHEEYVYIIDFLPHGRMDSKISRDPIAYAVGEDFFKLFELIMVQNMPVQIGDRIYVGKDITKRKEIKQVRRRITYNDLTPTAQNQLEPVIKQIIEKNEKKYVDFINNSQPISKKFHMLELMPGIGKRTMQSMVDEMRKKKFTSFKDIEERVHVHNLVDIFFNRIKLELVEEHEKYHLFVTK